MQLNKVTWYSKLIALILFVAMPFIGFYLGMQFQKTVDSFKVVSSGQVYQGAKMK